MEMKVDRDRLRSEREKRAWSQEHLARASGLSLRTIHRIESSGVASYESVQALAAVFSLQIEEITTPSNRKLGRPSIWRAAAGLAAITFFASTAVFFSGNSRAEQVMLDVGISQNNEDMREGQLLTADGKEAEIQVNDIVRVLITPTIQDDGKVFLSVQIYEIVGGKSVLISEPKLITANNKEAEIRLNGDNTGNTFKVVVTPHTRD
jgi:transcriptional regulator with XRE-family HTH domain